MMDSGNYATDSNAKQLTFTPEVKRITRLNDMKDIQIIKSPSWPSSPAISRYDLRQDSLPQFWTLGRKKVGATKISDSEDFSAGSELSRDEAISEIQSILSSMDLTKYYLRKPKGPLNNSLDNVHQQPLRRSQSVQPQLYTNGNNSYRSFLDNIPPPPKTKTMLISNPLYGENESCNRDPIYSLELAPVKNSRRSVNSKLRELTDKLRSSSAPPSPHRKHKHAAPHTAPPTSDFSFWTDPLPDFENNFEVINKDIGLNEHFLDRLPSPDSSLKNTPKSPQKKTLSSGNYATLPRTGMVSHNKRNQNGLRTLASLDLNINFDSFRNNRSSFDDGSISSKGSRSSSKDNDKKDRHKDEGNRITNENSNKHVREENAGSRNSSRRGSLKNSSSTSQRADFDLNFVKYGSLTPQEKRVERRKSIGKNEKSNFEPKSLPVSMHNSDNEEESKRLHSNENLVKERRNSRTKDSVVSKENNKSPKQFTESIAAESAPASPPSFTKPLEEEIRTIAKLLDGKESLFLKLIQSSNIVSDPQNGDMMVNRPFSPPLPESDITPTLRRKAATLPNTGRSSPSRTRSMTVSGTESKHNVVSSPPLQQKRFYKKRLRGPYGEMLEQEMSKSVNKPRPSYAKDLEFLKELNTNTSGNNEDLVKQQPARPRPLLRSSSHSLDETHSVIVDSAPKRKTSANLPVVTTNGGDISLSVPSVPVIGTVSEPTLHIRSHSDSVKTSSSWNTDIILSKILKQDSQQDTRTHIVAELYETEMSYVDSLQIIVKKYMIPLKNSEHSTDHDKAQMDIIFYQVPELLKFHEAFLDSLKVRLRYWDTKHVIGDIFVDVFTRQELVDTYNEFINNWKAARDAVKSISAAKPAFARYLELASREHKGKLSLDALLIMPVQRIPRYELLLKELLKHTSPDHPDSKLLAQAANEVHDLAVKINKVEREAMQQEKRIQKLSDVEQLIDGISDLANGDHDFVQYDFVQIPGGLGMKKERCLFLFSDMLLITSVKKKGTGAIRKSSVAVCTSTSASLEGNKYKLLMKASLHDIDIIKTDVDEPCVRKYLKEVKSLKSDISTLEKINEMTSTLNNHYQSLDLAIKDVLSNLSQELAEKQSSGSQLMTLELAVHVNNDVEHLNIFFSNPEQRMSWEAAFLDAKDNLIEKSLYPEFLCSLPLEKTRPGMQITCAAATVESCQSGLPDVWICSSDGFVGQVSVLTFQNEPVISSCVNICNARILCIAAVPGVNSKYLMMRRRSTLLPYLPGFNYEKLKKSDMEQTVGKSISLDSDSDDEFIDAQDEDINEDANTLQPTMWLGTEDGCIFVYNCTDIKLQKARLRMHHSTCIYDIIHVNDKVFISLANGDIIIYARDHSGLWNTCSPQKIHFGTNVSPISKMVLVDEKLWCSTLNSVAIIGTTSHEVQFTFPVGSDLMRHITAIVKSGFGMWIAVQSSPVIHLYHTTTHMHLLEINVTSAVTKLLNNYDEIIRQHKLVCLRVTALSIEKDTLWIGTSAGVVLSLPIPPLDSSTTEIDIMPNIIGIPHGHVGHVRFITNICATSVKKSSIPNMSEGECSYAERKHSIANNSSALVISGGDGYEDFGNSDASNILGCGDSTNHLLMWKV